jgi:hypothetical protein
MFWKTAKDTLREDGLLASSDMFAIFFSWIFVIGLFLGLATGAWITETLELQNTWRGTSVMISSTLLGCLLFTVIHGYYKERLVKRTNPRP